MGCNLSIYNVVSLSFWRKVIHNAIVPKNMHINTLLSPFDCVYWFTFCGFNHSSIYTKKRQSIGKMKVFLKTLTSIARREFIKQSGVSLTALILSFPFYKSFKI